MNKNNFNDQLDKEIDALLASRPLQAPDDFAERVLSAVGTTEATRQSSRRNKLLEFAMPLAAAVAVAITLAIFMGNSEDTADNFAETSPTLQETLLLEDGLTPLTEFESDDLAVDGLLSTLEALYYHVES